LLVGKGLPSFPWQWTLADGQMLPSSPIFQVGRGENDVKVVLAAALKFGPAVSVAALA
jgi:hypothetical protein